jgi:hypothetical protein
MRPEANIPKKRRLWLLVSARCSDPKFSESSDHHTLQLRHFSSCSHKVPPCRASGAKSLSTTALASRLGEKGNPVAVRPEDGAPPAEDALGARGRDWPTVARWFAFCGWSSTSQAPRGTAVRFRPSLAKVTEARGWGVWGTESRLACVFERCTGSGSTLWALCCRRRVPRWTSRLQRGCLSGYQSSHSKKTGSATGSEVTLPSGPDLLFPAHSPRAVARSSSPSSAPPLGISTGPPLLSG